MARSETHKEGESEEHELFYHQTWSQALKCTYLPTPSFSHLSHCKKKIPRKGLGAISYSCHHCKSRYNVQCVCVNENPLLLKFVFLFLKKNMKAKRTAKPNPDYFLTWHKEEWWLENPQAADSLYARKCLDEANPGNNFSHHLLPCLVYTGMSLEWGGRPETTIKISC